MLEQTMYMQAAACSPESAHLVANVLLHSAPAASVHALLYVGLQAAQALLNTLLVISGCQPIHILEGKAVPLVLLIVSCLVDAALKLCKRPPKSSQLDANKDCDVSAGVLGAQRLCMGSADLEGFLQSSGAERWSTVQLCSWAGHQRGVTCIPRRKAVA